MARHRRSISACWAPSWRWWLAMLGLAVVNRFQLMPRGNDTGIARNAAIELGVGLMVVLLAGALGQLQPVL